MKRAELVKKLIAEGISEKTLVNLSDKHLNELAERLLEEQVTPVAGASISGSTVNVSSRNPNMKNIVTNLQKQGFKNINVTEEGNVNEEKPSAGLSKEKKSEVVKKAKKGGDIGKKGKGFEKIVAKAKESGAKDPKAVAAAAMWKNIKRENKEVKEWVNSLAEQNFHSFTSKNEIMELIQVKLNEDKPAPSKPSPDAPVREKPTTKPGKPKRENPFEPKHNPKPKALKEEGEEQKSVPSFISFKNLGIKFKDSK